MSLTTNGESTEERLEIALEALEMIAGGVVLGERLQMVPSKTAEIAMKALERIKEEA